MSCVRLLIFRTGVHISQLVFSSGLGALETGKVVEEVDEVEVGYDGMVWYVECEKGELNVKTLFTKKKIIVFLQQRCTWYFFFLLHQSCNGDVLNSRTC